MRKCHRCGSRLDDCGFCTDLTCPFSDYLQSDNKGWIGHPEYDESPFDNRFYEDGNYDIGEN